MAATRKQPYKKERKPSPKRVGDIEDSVEKPDLYYKLVCQHCDSDGYISYGIKLPFDSCNIHPPDDDGFEMLPHSNEGWITIKHKCNRCRGLKYYLYYSGEWELQEMHPK
jgi:hypothetical protein